MRQIIQAIARQQLPDHAGLAYDVWCPVGLNEKGKPDTEEQERWLERLEAMQVPVDYQWFYERWKAGLELDGSRASEGVLAGRLLVGHGNPSPMEVGLTVHRTWGVPVIPGSALKGLLANYVQTVYGPEDLKLHPLDPTHPEPDRALWRGVGWSGPRIRTGPGVLYRALFGAPAAETDADAELHQRWLEHHPGESLERMPLGETQGEVAFHDALLVPTGTGQRPFARDVLTVHQKRYYQAQGNGGAWPNDYDDPNPVSFLTVRPRQRFLLSLSGDPAWTKLAMELLQRALVEWGIGGKTSAGYGRFDERAWKAVITPERRIPDADGTLQQFLGWFKETSALEQRVRLERITLEWLGRLRRMTPEARAEAGREIRRTIKSPRLEELKKALLDQLS